MALAEGPGAPGPLSATGADGTITIEGEWVTIRRSALAALVKHGRGENRYHVSQITSIDFKPRGLTAGHLGVVVAGAPQFSGSAGKRIKKDPNSITFNLHAVDFEVVRDAIETAIADFHSGQRGSPPQARTAGPLPPPPSSQPAPPPAPPAWMSDPTGRHGLRYWDGSRWTEHVSDGGLQGVADPL